MTQPIFASTPTVVQAPSCWTSFTNACSSALRTLAHGVSKVWAAIKHGCSYLYASITPLVAKAALWMKANPQTAAISAAVGAVATAVGVYFCCCRTPAAPVTTPAQPPVGNP